MAAFLFASLAPAQEVAPQTSIVISVAEQKLLLLRNGCLYKKYQISTSKFGIGDSFGSYKTPTGNLRVCEKIGEELAPGSVIKERHATGEVLPANAPGRDPIVTRVLWLDGLEEGNHNARSRGIYIHGTTEESKIGKPVSYGCIRMRSKDVQEVFDEASIDTPVQIMTDKFPKYAKYVPPKPQVIVAAPPPKPTPVAGKPAPATPPPIASAPAPSAPTTVALKKGQSTAIASVPAPIYHPPTVDSTPHYSVTTTEISNSALSHAMQGSILSAGLPDGPKMQNLQEPQAPKDVTRFGRMGPNPPKEQGLSLQNPDVDLAPALKAAEADANARAAKQASDAGNSGKQDAAVAFRTGQPDKGK